MMQDKKDNTQHQPGHEFNQALGILARGSGVSVTNSGARRGTTSLLIYMIYASKECPKKLVADQGVPQKTLFVNTARIAELSKERVE
jgi:hypothetical protein